jgi:hypothetical protein
MSSILADQYSPRLCMSPNAGGGVVAGSQPLSTAVHMEPKKLWRPNYVFNLWSLITVSGMRINGYVID